MRKHNYKWLKLLTVACVSVCLWGCGPDPEKAGDECDPDDGCPGDLVCAAGGDDHICYNPPGGACDPAGPDYCLGDSVCGTDENGNGVCGIPEGGQCDPADSKCSGGQVCAEMSSGGYACYPPVLVKGMVFDASTTVGIEGAHVIALDDQDTAVTDVAVTDGEGNYELELRAPRDDDGAPGGGYIFKLRSSAADYQTFPGGLRTSLPITTDEAGAAEAGWVIQTTLTDIALIPLPDEEQGRPSISGTVLAGDESGGVLVVAESGTEGISAVSDLAGAYTIFNVPDGAHQVRGYAAGLQLVPVDVTVEGAELTGIDLAQSGEALGSVSGSVNIVNAPGGSMTSVVLIVESTFSDTFVRGEVPRGLRSPLSGPPDVTGAFTIEGVPEGNYVVLAAFENDDLVRDPDPNIAGTQIVKVTMGAPGTDLTLDSSFKITEALEVFGPGAEEAEAVSSAPLLRWADDSSETFYTVVVYNAYGDLVWCLSNQEPTSCDGDNILGVSGSDEVSVQYDGPLEPGMYYQFRASSWRGNPPGPIATTEDLRGVFYVAE